MRCVLIYNPVSGKKQSDRAQQLRRVETALVGLGHAVEIVATTGPGSGIEQARKAVSQGAEIVFACGGDGTVHEVVQGLIWESGRPVAALGVIPLGSANALARHLGLSFDPVEAALQSIGGSQQTIPVGKLVYGDEYRYFIVMAGAGPDGALVHDLVATEKAKLGRLAYYVRAARLFATRWFRPFQIDYVEAGSTLTVSARAVGVMAVRVDDLGGLFRGLTSRSASIFQPGLQLLILRPPALLALPLWFVSGWLGLRAINPFLTSVQAESFSCEPIAGRTTDFEADGEWLGRIPVHGSIVPGVLSILIPAQSRTTGTGVPV